MKIGSLLRSTSDNNQCHNNGYRHNTDDIIRRTNSSTTGFFFISRHLQCHQSPVVWSRILLNVVNLNYFAAFTNNHQQFSIACTCDWKFHMSDQIIIHWLLDELSTSLITVCCALMGKNELFYQEKITPRCYAIGSTKLSLCIFPGWRSQKINHLHINASKRSCWLHHLKFFAL